ncbi:hypothetical protein MLD38_017148 [Melastoma candidum]|uniref:Uncharacterized protein n=1 Tax=Melastoma candidum TaxID=119954 RepID=A0ACB9QP33_9MYRT|nr:hypothetical protein MLD38_017148 [Melastoma candidum]
MAATSRSHKESSCLPFTSIKVAALLQRRKSLQALVMLFHIINLAELCSQVLTATVNRRRLYIIFLIARSNQILLQGKLTQLILILPVNITWSGVLDLCNLSVAHIHCPPPTWLNGDDLLSTLHWRRPSWLPSHSIYVVGSVSQKGIHLLDFFPHVRSVSRVDYSYDEGSHIAVNAVGQGKVNKFVPFSDPVISCTVHPFDSTVIAGTEKESLLVISQRHGNC